MNINTKTIKASIQSIGNSLVVYGFITSLFIKVKKKYFPFIVLAIIYNINPTININNFEIKNYFTSPPTSPVPHIANNGRFTLEALTSFVETDLVFEVRLTLAPSVLPRLLARS